MARREVVFIGTALILLLLLFIVDFGLLKNDTPGSRAARGGGGGRGAAVAAAARADASSGRHGNGGAGDDVARRARDAARRMMYWHHVRDEPVTRLDGASDGQTRYFVFQTWQGGFNNERMSLELAFVFALLTRRTLVLPPKYPLYLLDTSELTDYFSLEGLLASGVPVMTFAEYVRDVLSLQMPPNGVVPHGHELWGAVAAHADVTLYDELSIAGTNQGQQCWVYPRVPEPSAAEELARIRDWCLANSKPFSVLGGALETARSVYVPTRKLFDHYYTHIYFRDPLLGRQVMHAVRQHVHLVDDAFAHAARIVARLPPHFNALHVRRNDFQYKDIRHLPVATIIANTKPAVPPTEPLYIATDEHDPAFLSEWRDLYTPARIWSLDANFSAVLDDTPKHWLGIVEMLVCTQAEMFIGSRLSTFSGYITRMRGYMGRAYQETHFTSDNATEWLRLEQEQGREGFRVGSRLPLWKGEWDWSTWGREFKDAWDERLMVWQAKTVREGD